MKKIVKLTESDLVKLVNRVIKEQQSPPNTQYMAAGTKFCFFGSCRVDIKVVNKSFAKKKVQKPTTRKTLKKTRNVIYAKTMVYRVIPYIRLVGPTVVLRNRGFRDGRQNVGC